MAFQENEVLATFDRSWDDRKERLQLERGSYNGKPTFALRVCWQADDNTWRWSQARLNDKGKAFQAMSIKARELRALGEALIQAAADIGKQRAGQPRQQRSAKVTPQRQAELNKLDAAGKAPTDFDEDIPF